jgi:hypothetical protein
MLQKNIININEDPFLRKLKPKLTPKLKFLLEQDKLIPIKKVLFIKKKEKDKEVYYNYGKYILNKKTENASIKQLLNSITENINEHNISIDGSSDFTERKNNVLKTIRKYSQQVILPNDFNFKEDMPKTKDTKIKIRKTKILLEKACNPIMKNEEGISKKYCLGTLPIDDIHPSKFIMLNNNTCYDIELIVNYVANQYNIRENYNIEPEYCKDPIWYNDNDIKKILNHPLIKNPEKLADNCYLYSKNNYLLNTILFKKIIHEYNIDKEYFDLFDKYPQFLIGLNRLGTIFHIEQPTSYFNLDNIKFEEINGVVDDKVNIITDKLVNIIKITHHDKLINNDIKDLDGLIKEIDEIINEQEYAYFSDLVHDLNIELTHKQLQSIIKNIAQMIAFQFNFHEGTKAKMEFINYINNMDNDNKKIALSLVNDIIYTDECIHLQGNKLRYIFVKWWFKYLNYYGIKNEDICQKYVPLTYGKILNDISIVKSSLLEKYSETTHGYHPSMCPNKGNVCFHYKMGSIPKWDGINLKSFTFCCRLGNAPFS